MIFKDHFEEFKEVYDKKYASKYENYRIDKIAEVVEEFLKCGYFNEGVARVKCENSDCGHDYFVLIQDYYNKVSSKNITTGLVLSHQTAGDFARPNPHWHGLLIEEGTVK